MTLSNILNGLTRIAAAGIFAALIAGAPGDAEARGAGMMSLSMQSFAATQAAPAPVAYKVYSTARLVCINGKIAGGNCYCGAGYRKFQFGPNKYKCMKMPGGYSRKTN